MFPQGTFFVSPGNLFPHGYILLVPPGDPFWFPQGCAYRAGTPCLFPQGTFFVSSGKLFPHGYTLLVPPGDPFWFPQGCAYRTGTPCLFPQGRAYRTGTPCTCLHIHPSPISRSQISDTFSSVKEVMPNEWSETVCALTTLCTQKPRIHTKATEGRNLCLFCCTDDKLSPSDRFHLFYPLGTLRAHINSIYLSRHLSGRSTAHALLVHPRSAMGNT